MIFLIIKINLQPLNFVKYSINFSSSYNQYLQSWKYVIIELLTHNFWSLVSTLFLNNLKIINAVYNKRQNNENFNTKILPSQISCTKRHLIYAVTLYFSFIIKCSTNSISNEGFQGKYLVTQSIYHILINLHWKWVIPVKRSKYYVHNMLYPFKDLCVLF